MNRAFRMSAIAGALGALAVAATIELPVTARAQHAGHEHGMMPPKAEAPPQAPAYRLSMEELHRHGGTPRGWKFTLPPGDAGKGRAVFESLECYKCHTVKNGGFPQVAPDAKNVGPELTGMGGMHPGEYLAESILAPNRVIVEGPGYTGPDGLSVMPSFADSLTLAQWTDLVAYLKSLTAGGHEHGAGHGAAREREAGDYRVRLVYMAGGHGAMSGGAGGMTMPGMASGSTSAMHGAATGASREHHPGSAAGGATPSPHLMAFVLDRVTGEPVPYLPVSVTVRPTTGARRTIRLSPMLDDDGFHYGADVALSTDTRHVTVTIGATTMQVMGASGRFKKPATAEFDWTAP
jgi:mono/diheme cytochrome c family protein